MLKEKYLEQTKERQTQINIRGGKIIEAGLISVFVTKEQKQTKYDRRMSWKNIISMGLKFKEINEENLYAWGKIDELNQQIDFLKAELEKIKKEKA